MYALFLVGDCLLVFVFVCYLDIDTSELKKSFPDPKSFGSFRMVAIDFEKVIFVLLFGYTVSHGCFMLLY